MEGGRVIQTGGKISRGGFFCKRDLSWVGAEQQSSVGGDLGELAQRTLWAVVMAGRRGGGGCDRNACRHWR